MNAFIDTATGRLKCFGYVDTNEPGDVKLEVSEDFYYDLKKTWIYDGKSFQEALPRPKEIPVELDTVLKDPLVPDSLKAYLSRSAGITNVNRPT